MGTLKAENIAGCSYNIKNGIALFSSQVTHCSQAHLGLKFKGDEFATERNCAFCCAVHPTLELPYNGCAETESFCFNYIRNIWNSTCRLLTIWKLTHERDFMSSGTTWVNARVSQWLLAVWNVGNLRNYFWIKTILMYGLLSTHLTGGKYEHYKGLTRCCLLH